MEKLKLMRFIKKNYKKIGVAVLVVFLAISTVINVRLMTGNEAKEVASLGSYERYDEIHSDDESQDLYDSQEDGDAEQQGLFSKLTSKFSKGSDETKGNRLQDGSVFDKSKSTAAQTTTKSSNKKSVKTTKKPSNVVAAGTNVKKTDSAVKPKETSENGEREKLSKFIGEAWNHSGDRYLYILYQDPDYSKEITVTVQVDYLSIFEDGVVCNDDRFADRLNTDGYILHPTQITCYEGENCWDAIARALIANDIQYTCDAEPFKHGYTIDNKYGTCYLTCCDNMYTGVNTEDKPGPFGTSMSGWTYTVTNASGKTVYPGLGMNGVLVKDGDTLCLKYHNGLNAFAMDEYGDF